VVSMPRAAVAGTGADLPLAARIERVLRLLAVAVPVVVVVVAGALVAFGRLGPAGVVPRGILLPAMLLIFTFPVSRLAVAAVRRPERRFALLALTGALALWAAGFTQVNTPAPADGYPAPGEVFFLASSLALAGHLFLDHSDRVRPTAADWLEAAVTGGGAVCLVALAVLEPFADEFARRGAPLLLALVYPAVDAMLLGVVIAQVVLRRRVLSTATWILAAALLLLLAADAGDAVTDIETGTYAFGLVGVVCWCLAYVLLAESACRPRIEPQRETRDSAAAGWITLTAAGAALAVLTFQPLGPARAYVAAPAVLTVLAAGARLALALRDARNAATAYRLSRTDDLTGLPNRRAVVSDLAAGMATDAPLTVVLLDLDGFKEINDSLGHGAGDGLLQIIARRLRHALPDDVLAARLAGDEFALVLEHADVEAVTELAQEIRRLIRRPIHLDGLELSVDSAAGIAMRSAEMTTKGDLLRCADVAMTLAKRSGAGVAVYDPGQDEFSRDRLALAEELRNGLEKGQVVVWYQPQVDAASGRVVAVEALVRWRHPAQGLLAPFAFLPAARRAGLMPRLTEIVLAGALRDLAAWRAGGHEIDVAVNIAPPELLGGTVLPDLGAMLAREGVPPERLVVEVTEDSFLADPDHARRVIHGLRELGVQVSIDDYGTGFSSLAYLRDLPLQELKIDRSFVADILHDPRSSMIVETTNRLAHGLGLRTVAEGVEDEDQRAELHRMGVDLLQGYHFARPMPAGHVAAWLDERRRTPLPTLIAPTWTARPGD
jgi:diguanylate cyclase